MSLGKLFFLVGTALCVAAALLTIFVALSGLDSSLVLWAIPVLVIGFFLQILAAWKSLKAHW